MIVQINWTFTLNYLGSECLFRYFFILPFYDKVATISDIVIIFH
jgi:hypothetical protein